MPRGRRRDADGGGPRHRPRGPGGENTIRARYDCGRAARRVDAPRRRPDGAGPRPARCGHRSAFTPQRRDGVVYAHTITNDEARIDWSGRPVKSPIGSTGCRPSPAPSSRSISARDTRAREGAASRPGRGCGHTGTLCDTDCTVACGDGRAVGSWSCDARGRAAARAGPSSSAAPA